MDDEHGFTEYESLEYESYVQEREHDNACHGEEGAKDGLRKGLRHKRNKRGG